MGRKKYSESTFLSDCNIAFHIEHKNNHIGTPYVILAGVFTEI